jgi:hypothetical protein
LLNERHYNTTTTKSLQKRTSGGRNKKDFGFLIKELLKEQKFIAALMMVKVQYPHRSFYFSAKRKTVNITTTKGENNNYKGTNQG